MNLWPLLLSPGPYSMSYSGIGDFGAKMFYMNVLNTYITKNLAAGLVPVLADLLVSSYKVTAAKIWWINMSHCRCCCFCCCCCCCADWTEILSATQQSFNFDSFFHLFEFRLPDFFAKVCFLLHQLNSEGSTVIGSVFIHTFIDRVEATEPIEPTFFIEAWGNQAVSLRSCHYWVKLLPTTVRVGRFLK